LFQSVYICALDEASFDGSVDDFFIIKNKLSLILLAAKATSYKTTQNANNLIYTISPFCQHKFI